MVTSGFETPSLRRPRWRAYLLLSRVSNLPTVWSNVLAGMAVAASHLVLSDYVRVACATSLFYTGGMVLNDAFDAGIDARARPERPLPRGDVGRSEAFVAGGALLTLGVLLLAPHLEAMLGGLVLTLAILYYNYHHKGVRTAPLVMGLCRSLVYVVAAVFVATLSPGVVVAATVMLLYVAGLTVVARLSGPDAKWLVPLLIAGISLVDAVVIVVASPVPLLALVAVACFALTLFLQRYVPGD